MPSRDSRAMTRSPSPRAWRHDFPGAERESPLDPRRASGENPHGCRSSRKPLRCPRPREVRAFFSCLSWRAIPSPLSKLKIRLDSLEATQRAPRDPRRGSGENPHGRRSSRKHLRCLRPRELRTFFFCMAWRAIPGPLSKRKRRLDSLGGRSGGSKRPASRLERRAESLASPRDEA